MINFPDSPTNGQQFTSGGNTWTWDTHKWVPQGAGPFVPIAGGTMTGLLTLSGPPTSALNAATKAYVDGFLPLTGGTLSGNLTAPNFVATSGLSFGSPLFQWYVGSSVAYLWNAAHGNLVGVDTSGNTTITGSLVVQGASLNVGNRAFGSVAGTYNYLYDGSANAAMLLGGSGDQQTYYRNNGHQFQSAGGSTGLFAIGTTQITSLIPHVCSSSLSTGTTLTVGTSLQVNGGANAIYAPSGNIVAGGNIQFGGCTWQNSGGNAYTPQNLQTAGYININGMLWQNSGGWMYTANALMTGAQVQVGTTLYAGGVISTTQQIQGGNFSAYGGGGARLITNTGDTWGIQWTGNYNIFTYGVGNINVSNCVNIGSIQTVSGGPTGNEFVYYDTSSNGYVVYVDAVSDARMKRNITDSDIDALALLCAVPVRQFDWHDLAMAGAGEEHRHVDLGLVAQELMERIPAAVPIKQDRVLRHEDDPLPDDLLYINSKILVPYLVRAIQQLADEVADLRRAMA